MRKCVAVYLRLSLEDVDKRTNRAKDESNSIVSQRQLIQRYLEQDASLSRLPRMEFCDDGFSGTNFERPDFQRMIELARAGEIKTVVVKDLSRFGRDYLEVGDYLEHIFPFLGVRMISVNDHYDSDSFQGNTAGMEVAFRNLIYDYYSKDLSQKVKSAMRTKQRNGGYVSCCTYGYRVDPKNKHKMLIDPEAAAIVRRIFTEAIAEKSTSQIARGLNEDGVLTPQQYKGVSRKKDSPTKALWTHNRILEMLKNIKYTGCMVNHTCESMAIRATAQRRVPKEEWIYHENAHEAIVTAEEFEAAQAALRKVRPYTKKKREDGFPFYCAHCGRKLQRTFGTDEHFYCVTPYWDTSEEACKLVRWDRTELEGIVLEALRAQISVMSVKAVSKAKNTVSQGLLLQQRLKALTEEVKGSDGKKMQSYLDYREGRISREEYIAFRNSHESRLAELEEMIAKTETEYEEYLQEENRMKREKELAKQTSSMSKAALKKWMYDAVERINVSDNRHLEIVWKFDDLFATA